jgi:hypothetical protein
MQVSLTQATQLPASARVAEWKRLRRVILDMPQSDVLQVRLLAFAPPFSSRGDDQVPTIQCDRVDDKSPDPRACFTSLSTLRAEFECNMQHIRECDMDGAAIERFCLVIYACSYLFPSDTADDIRSLRSSLEQFLLAVLQRAGQLGTEGTAHWTDVLLRVTCNALEACSNPALFTVISLALESLRAESPAVKHMLTLFSVALSQLLMRKGRDADLVLRRANLTEKVLNQLFAMSWPASLIAPILKSVRSSGLLKENALFTEEESKRMIASVVAAGSKACSHISTADAEQLPQAIEGLLQLVQPSTLQHVQLVCGVVGDWTMHVEEMREAVSTAEAATLAIVADSLMRNQTVANQWVKAFKSNASFSSFDLSVALMLCSCPLASTQQKVLEAIKSSITTCIQHEQALQGSRWLSEQQCTPHRSPRVVAVMLHDVAMSPHDKLISQLLAFAQNLLSSSSSSIKGVRMAQVSFVEQEDYVGLEWWTVEALNSCWCVAGAAILEHVRPSSMNKRA